MIKNYLIITSLIFIAINSQSCQNESIDQNYGDNDNDGYISKDEVQRVRKLLKR